MSLSPVQSVADSSLGRAILRGVVYSDLFDAAITLPELHRYLEHSRISRAALAGALHEAVPSGRLCQHDGLLALAGREPLIELRRRRRERSEASWGPARRWAGILSALPFVRMVAVTGTLAVANLEGDDDIDYLIVTEPGRLWTCRAFVVAAFHLARRAGISICPNYILSLDALALEERDPYTARELVQMVPVFGENVYERMRALNSWADRLFPHAGGPPTGTSWLRQGPAAASLKKALEALLHLRVFDALERDEQRRRTERLLHIVVPGSSSARFDSRRCKAHLEDRGPEILVRFGERLRTLDLDETLDG